MYRKAGKKSEGEESKSLRLKFSERYRLLKKRGKKREKRTIIWETADTPVSVEPRAVCHAFWFGAMATRSLDERRRPRDGMGAAARGVEVGVKRNIFQQISHVCLIMYITACGAENQSTTAAIAAGVATHPTSSRPRSSSNKREDTRPVRRNILF